MATSAALQGGISVIHASVPVANQHKEVAKIEEFKPSFAWDPVCNRPALMLEAPQNPRSRRDLKRLSAKSAVTINGYAQPHWLLRSV